MSIVKWKSKTDLSAVRVDFNSLKLDKLRSKILSLCENYMNIREKPTYRPGIDVIPASSKILDTEGQVARFNKRFSGLGVKTN